MQTFYSCCSTYPVFGLFFEDIKSLTWETQPEWVKSFCIAGKLSIEGKILNKFDLRLHQDSMENYEKICRERTNKYMTKTRQIQVLYLLSYIASYFYWLIGHISALFLTSTWSIFRSSTMTRDCLWGLCREWWFLPVHLTYFWLTLFCVIWNFVLLFAFLGSLLLQYIYKWQYFYKTYHPPLHISRAAVLQ